MKYRAHIDQKAATGPPGRRHGGKGSAVLGPALDGKPLAAHRREVRNERIFRFVCLETACDAYVGAWPRRSSSAMALAEDRSVRPIPARASLYARPRPEMARKARAQRWALEPTPVHNGRLGRRMVEKLTLQERRAVIPDALIHACIADAFSGVSKQMQPFSAPRLPAEQRNSAPRAVLLQAASNSSSSALRSDSSRRSSALWAGASALPRVGERIPSAPDYGQRFLMKATMRDRFSKRTAERRRPVWKTCQKRLFYWADR